MDDREVLLFIQRLTASAGNAAQADMRLMQLESILEPLDCPAAIELVKKARESLPEVTEASKAGPVLSREALEGAAVRAQERKEREQMYARC